MESSVLLPKALQQFVWLCILIHGIETSEPLQETKSSPDTSKYLQIVDSDSLESLKSSKTLSIIYYNTTVEIPSKAKYLRAMNESAFYLSYYNIDIALVDCVSTQSIPQCQNETVGTNIYTYQNSTMLIMLELDTMFDVNSIMSNALQLLLLRQVPLVQSQVDREALESSLVGKRDLFFLYTKAIGTYVHRIFMELAYAFQDQYEFATTTEFSSTKGFSSHRDMTPTAKYELWTLHCSKSSTDEGNSRCHSSRYESQYSLSTLTNYMERLLEPHLLYAPENETQCLSAAQDELPWVYIFTQTSLKHLSDPVSQSLALDVRGFANVCVVDVNNEDWAAKAAVKGFTGQVPFISVVNKDGEVLNSKLTDLELSEVRKIVLEDDSNAIDYSSDVHDVEIQDDEVAIEVAARATTDKTQHSSLAVTKRNFHSVVESADLKMVLYYLPFDTMSLALLHDFGVAAQQLSSSLSMPQDVLARVNCYDATDLCALENITTYPVIRIHRMNVQPQLYEGPLDTESLVKAVDLLRLKFPLTLSKEDEVNKFAAAQLPPIVTELSPSSVIFIARHGDKETWTTFKAASKRLDYMVAMAQVSDNLIDAVARKYEVSVPCVVTIHHSDTVQPIKKLQHIGSVDQVVSFARQSRVATMPELTVANFPTLFAKNLPFVILFLNQSADEDQSSLKSTMTRMAAMTDFKDSIFCWMDSQNGTLGHNLLLEYTKNGTVTLPSLAVVHHEKAQVFTQQSVDTLTSDLMTEWLRSVFTNKLHPCSTLRKDKWLPPGPHFDFLAKMDEDLKEELDGLLSRADRLQLEKEDEIRKKLLERRKGSVGFEEQGSQKVGTAGKNVQESVPVHAEL